MISVLIQGKRSEISKWSHVVHLHALHWNASLALHWTQSMGSLIDSTEFTRINWKLFEIVSYFRRTAHHNLPNVPFSNWGN